MSILNRKSKYQYKDDYEKFKLILNGIGLFMAIINLSHNSRWFMNYTIQYAFRSKMSSMQILFRIFCSVVIIIYHEYYVTDNTIHQFTPLEILLAWNNGRSDYKSFSQVMNTGVNCFVNTWVTRAFYSVSHYRRKHFVYTCCQSELWSVRGGYNILNTHI